MRNLFLGGIGLRVGIGLRGNYSGRYSVKRKLCSRR
jgi:hypothetical protein